MFRPTHHTYYKGVGPNINLMNRPKPVERVHNTNVGQIMEFFCTLSPEELGILADGKKAAEDDLSRLIQTGIAAKTTPVKVSHNDRTKTMCPLHQYTHLCRNFPPFRKEIWCRSFQL